MQGQTDFSLLTNPKGGIAVKQLLGSACHAACGALSLPVTGLVLIAAITGACSRHSGQQPCSSRWLLVTRGKQSQAQSALPSLSKQRWW